MTNTTDILATVVRLLEEVMGDEWEDDLDVDLETSFADDLELESIEFVALAEKLQAAFGGDVNFVAWMSELELDAIIGLTVGDVVRFIERSAK